MAEKVHDMHVLSRAEAPTHTATVRRCVMAKQAHVREILQTHGYTWQRRFMYVFTMSSRAETSPQTRPQ